MVRRLTTPSPPRTGIRHLPALDGLRGVALLGVLFFHAGGALPGGYLGVDLFFVLSGYLITTLLLAEHRDTGRVVLSAFWVRRARRLFPALLSLMPAVALYARFVALPGELPRLRADALATLGYVANWRTIVAGQSYWDLFAAPSPLEHMWSLSIEEQFYVVWPLAVALLVRRAPSPRALGRRVLVLALGLGALSMASMVARFDPASTSRAYLGTDTRSAGILAGAALATLLSPDAVLSPRAVRLLDALGLIAAAGLAVAWSKLPGSSRFLYHGGFWLTEIAVLVLIACAVAGPSSVVARALALRPLTLAGTVSYGAYLWHWPVDVLLTPARVHLPSVWLHALQLAVTFAIAAVSYRFLESPIRRHGLPFGRALYVVPGAVALAVLLVVRATHARPPLGAPPAVAPDVREGDPLLGPPRLHVLVLGDSTANSLGWGLRGAQRPGLVVDLDGQGRLHHAVGHLRRRRVAGAVAHRAPGGDAGVLRRSLSPRHLGRRGLAEGVLPGVGQHVHEHGDDAAGGAARGRSARLGRDRAVPARAVRLRAMARGGRLHQPRFAGGRRRGAGGAGARLRRESVSRRGLRHGACWSADPAGRRPLRHRRRA